MCNLDLKGIEKFQSIVVGEEVMVAVFNTSRIIIVIK